MTIVTRTVVRRRGTFVARPAVQRHYCEGRRQTVGCCLVEFMCVMYCGRSRTHRSSTSITPILLTRLTEKETAPRHLSRKVINTFLENICKYTAIVVTCVLHLTSTVTSTDVCDSKQRVWGVIT